MSRKKTVPFLKSGLAWKVALPAQVTREVARAADLHAPRLGLSRRDFLKGPCGVAAMLLAINSLTGCRAYKVERGTLKDVDLAQAAVAGEEFIFDAQTHHVDARPKAVWPRNSPLYASLFDRINAAQACGRSGRFDCLSRDAYAEEIFAKSDTQVAILSGVPGGIGKSPLHNDEILATREQVNQTLGLPRVMASGLVVPNLGPIELDAMAELAERDKVVGFTVYTAYGPRDGTGFWLDDPGVGLPFLEQARKLKVKRIFCPKGLPWPNFDPSRTSPRDVGMAARIFSDLQFIVYHAGYDTAVSEGPYDPFGTPATADVGVNRLLKSLEENGIWPDQNVYAELGGTWRLLMNKPVEAAHVVGKLLKHLGENRVLWGSDAIFDGSPAPQIAAFRAFQIPKTLQEKHGYPALTPALKAKVLGLNAAALFGVDVRAYPRPGAR